MLNGRNFGLRIAASITLGLIAFASPASAAPHVRGTVVSVNDQDLSVMTASGETEAVKLSAETPLFLVTKTDLSAVNAGKFVGVTSVEKDGKRVAKEVHVFANSLRGLAEGHYPWDLGKQPNMMTNANIATVNSVGDNRVLSLEYKGGEQTIDVPADAPIVAFDKSGREQLVAGRKVFVILNKDSKDAAVVVIGSEGITPPM